MLRAIVDRWQGWRRDVRDELALLKGEELRSTAARLREAIERSEGEKRGKGKREDGNSRTR